MYNNYVCLASLCYMRVVPCFEVLQFYGVPHVTESDRGLFCHLV